MNVPSVIGAIVSSRLATLHELDTVYGLEAAYDLLEVISINNHNQRIASKPGK